MDRTVAIETVSVLGFSILMVIAGEMIANAAPEVATYSPPGALRRPEPFPVRVPGHLRPPADR